MVSSSFAFVANILNIVLATGIFTLPFSLWETGFFLGGVILLLVALISFTTSSLLIETIAISNALEYEELRILKSTVKDDSKVSISVNNGDVEAILNYSTKKSFIINTRKLSDASEHHKVAQENLIEKNPEEAEDNFFIYKRIEICKLAKKLNGPSFTIIMIVMVLYLYLSITSNALLLGNAFDKLITKEFGIIHDNNSVGPVYYITVVCYYILILNISQRNIEDLKKFTLIIMFARIVVICLLFGSMIYIINTYGISDFSESPKFDFSKSALMFGNTLFYFMIQHSIPGIIEGFSPQKNLLKLLFLSFLFSLILFYAYGIVSFLAFGKYTSCNLDMFPSAIRAYFNLNFLGLKVIGDIINYYPVFNIITGSIQMITLKNNILIILSNFLPSVVSIYSQARKSTTVKLYLLTLLFSTISILPSLALSLLLTNIQSLMKYFTSILGFMLMLIVPVLLIFNYRQKLKLSMIVPGNMNKSYLNNYGLYGFIVLSVGILVTIVINLLTRNDKDCVAG